MSAFQDRFIPVADEVALHVREYPVAGDAGGLPVLCLHGLTRNAADFEDVAPMIAARGRRVIVPTMRGRGQSGRDPQPRNYHNEVYAADVQNVLDTLGVPRAVFVGTSMGGLITMVLNRDAPGRVAAAVLNDIGPVLHPAGLVRIAGYIGKATAFPDWDTLVAAIREAQGPQYPDADEAFWRSFARRNRREMPDGTVEPDYDAMIAWALLNSGRPAIDMQAAFVALAQKPLLLLHGELSDLLTNDEIPEMQAAAPEMVVAHIPRVGHAPMLDEPASRDALWRFLDRVP